MPKLISHRGNLTSSIPELENTLPYILKALDYVDMVEVDLWYLNNGLYLGHDKPIQCCSMTFISQYADNLLIHAKNIEALYFLVRRDLPVEYFWHETDKYAITSLKHIITYPSNPLTPMSICMNPYQYLMDDILKCYGICCDDVENWRNDV